MRRLVVRRKTRNLSLLQAGDQSHGSNGPGDRASGSRCAVLLGSHLVVLDRRISTEAFYGTQDSGGGIGTFRVRLNFFSESRIRDHSATVSGKRKRLWHNLRLQTEHREAADGSVAKANGIRLGTLTAGGYRRSSDSEEHRRYRRQRLGHGQGNDAGQCFAPALLHHPRAAGAAPSGRLHCSTLLLAVSERPILPS